MIDEEDFAVRLLAEHEVAVQPGFLFDLPFESSLVLSLLTPETVWRRGLETLLDSVELELSSTSIG